MKTLDLSGLAKGLAKNKYVLAVLTLGLVLLLLPSGEKTNAAASAQGVGDELSASGIPVDTEAERIAAFLSQIEGVGECSVLLSAEGVVVACRGSDSAAVRLNVTNAVMAYTGLGSDKIIVMKMN